MIKIEPFLPKGEFLGYFPIRLERMMRMCVALWCFWVSCEGVADAICDDQAMHGLIRNGLSHERAPIATTLLKIRRLLEANHLTEGIVTASTCFGCQGLGN